MRYERSVPLADGQYGFRTDRSTVDAIMRVKAIIQEAMAVRGTWQSAVRRILYPDGY